MSWAILAASWAVLGDVRAKMVRNEAIRSAKRSHQRLPDGKRSPPSDGNRPGLGPLVPTIFRLQDPKILRFEYPKIRKPLSSLKTPLILRYNFEAPLILRSSNPATQPGGRGRRSKHAQLCENKILDYITKNTIYMIYAKANIS